MRKHIVKKWADRAWNEQLPVDDAIEGAVLEALADVVRDRDELLATLKQALEAFDGMVISGGGVEEWRALIRRIEDGE